MFIFRFHDSITYGHKIGSFVARKIYCALIFNYIKLQREMLNVKT